MDMKSKTPFAVILIKELSNNGFISSGIMLPLLVGAYALRDKHVESIDIKYLKYVFTDLMSELYETDRCLYFKECEASNNFVLSIAERPLKSYKLHIYYNGKPVIYCKDSDVDITIDNIDDAVNYFIDKYVSVMGKYCNFIDSEVSPCYPHMRPLDITGYLSAEYKLQKSELDIIQSILNNNSNEYN